REPRTEQLGRIRLVVDHKDADTHCWPGLFARQPHCKLRERAGFALDRDRAAMLVGDDVIADRQPKSGPLAGRLGREERLEEFILDVGWNAGPVVPDLDLDRTAQI